MCARDGHYANQCPSKDKGKTPTVNMVTTEVQEVITRSKAKRSEWDTQDEVRKAAKEWVEEANNNNVAQMMQENIELIVTSDKFNSRCWPSPATNQTKDRAEQGGQASGKGRSKAWDPRRNGRKGVGTQGDVTLMMRERVRKRERFTRIA